MLATNTRLFQGVGCNAARAFMPSLMGAETLRCLPATGLAKPPQLYLDARLRVFVGSRTIEAAGPMGEQPVPVEDEVERALASMRAGFLSGSEQIAAGIASLEEHLADAPFEERESVGATLAQIVKTQARLEAQVDRLPAPSWDRFKAMVSVVKAQQIVLDEVGLLVKEHVLPRQLQDLSVATLPAAPAPPYEPAPAPRRDVSSRADARRGPRSRARERTGPAFSGLAFMVVAGLFLSLLPRDFRLHDVAAKLVQMVGAGRESAPSQVADKKVRSGSPSPTAAPASRAERVPSLPDVAAVQDRPQPTPEAPRDQKDVPEPAAVKEPAVPAAGPPEERFVPVVFTHRDHDTVTRALSDLKRQYPSLLVGREGELQPVNLGKKGIWHRLVLLPAGPRADAKKLCDQLLVKGYDRCWVKAY